MGITIKPKINLLDKKNKNKDCLLQKSKSITLTKLVVTNKRICQNLSSKFMFFLCLQ